MRCAILASLAGSVGFAFAGASGTSDPSVAMQADAHGAHDMTQTACSSNKDDCMPVDQDAHGQHADCAMTVCCFSDLSAPILDLRSVAMTARYARIPTDPALQADPDRADKPPRRT